VADKDKQKPDSGLLMEVGTTGLKHSGGILLEEYVPKLQGFKDRVKAYKEMSETDPVVGSILFAINMQARSIPWTVTPASDSPEDIANKKFLEENIAGMSTPFSDVLSEALTMLPYGFSPMEIVYRLGDDGKIRWKKFAPRAQDTVERWKFDKDGGLRGLYQVDSYSGKGEVFIPIEKMLLFRSNTAKGSPEGQSVLRTAYRPFYIKKKLEVIEAIGLERDLAGYPVLQTPEDIWGEDDDSRKMRNYAKNLVTRIRTDEDMGAVLPPGWELKLTASEGGKASDMGTVISRHETRIAQSVLADIILMGHQSSGSFALAEVKHQIFADALSSWLTSIANVANKYGVKRLFKLNGMDLTEKELPKLTHGPVRAIDALRLANVIFRYVNTNIIKPDDDLEEYLRANLGLPIADTETQRVGDPKIDAQDKSKQSEREDNITRNPDPDHGYTQDNM